MDEDDDDDEEGGGPSSGAVVRTKNELPNDDINIPKISEVGPDEPLAKVGEIMSVVNNVVIVRGSTSGNQLKANEKALDSDTLLVFEDRKVMGYVCDPSLLLTVVPASHYLALDIRDLRSDVSAPIPSPLQ